MFKLTLHVIHIAMVYIQTQHDLYESMMHNLPLGEIELDPSLRRVALRVWILPFNVSTNGPIGYQVPYTHV